MCVCVCVCGGGGGGESWDAEQYEQDRTMRISFNVKLISQIQFHKI